MVSVKREGNRWYVILACDDVPAHPLPATGATVGIDMGVVSFLTTSNGKHVPNPRPLAVAAARLTATQQSLARKKRGSDRRRRAAARVGPDLTRAAVPLVMSRAGHTRPRLGCARLI
jgi:putative transposase